MNSFTVYDGKQRDNCVSPRAEASVFPSLMIYHGSGLPRVLKLLSTCRGHVSYARAHGDVSI